MRLGRGIYNAIAQAGRVENIEITPKLIHAYKNESNFYREDLKRTREENKKQEDEENAKKRRKLEIKELEEKKAQHISELARLTEEIQKKKQ